jgi:hypothetical protein
MKVNTDKSFAFLRLWLIVPLLFIVHHQAIAQIVINEGSNRNYPTLTDEDGDYEDWIEIHNAGNTPVDLYNYSLSDNASPGEWVFPHRVLNPGGFLVVFCSGKNRFETTPFTKVVSDSAFQPGSGWNAQCGNWLGKLYQWFLRLPRTLWQLVLVCTASISGSRR